MVEPASPEASATARVVSSTVTRTARHRSRDHAQQQRSLHLSELQSVPCRNFSGCAREERPLLELQIQLHDYKVRTGSVQANRGKASCHTVPISIPYANSAEIGHNPTPATCSGFL